MTPINFVSFLLSLLFVDVQWSAERYHTHAEVPSRLPVWLHGVLYRPQPYRYPHSKRDDQAPPWHYHSNQRKLMKVEAEEAFRMRNRVLLWLAVIAATLTGGFWYLGSNLYRRWRTV